MDYNNATFYFCDLKTNDIKCPKMNQCKRYEGIKDIPCEEYDSLGVAKLYNICNKENKYKMFMKMDVKDK